MRIERPQDEKLDFRIPEKNINNPGLINSDPLGSYTGRPFWKWETPVQDADDL